MEEWEVVEEYYEMLFFNYGKIGFYKYIVRVFIWIKFL